MNPISKLTQFIAKWFAKSGTSAFTSHLTSLADEMIALTQKGQLNEKSFNAVSQALKKGFIKVTGGAKAESGVAKLTDILSRGSISEYEAYMATKEGKAAAKAIEKAGFEGGKALEVEKQFQSQAMKTAGKLAAAVGALYSADFIVSSAEKIPGLGDIIAWAFNLPQFLFHYTIGQIPGFGDWIESARKKEAEIFGPVYDAIGLNAIARAADDTIRLIKDGDASIDWRSLHSDSSSSSDSNSDSSPTIEVVALQDGKTKVVDPSGRTIWVDGPDAKLFDRQGGKKVENK